MSDQAHAFAALEAILAGEWDRYLLRLRAAITKRLATEAYQQHIVAGKVMDMPDATPGVRRLPGMTIGRGGSGNDLSIPECPHCGAKGGGGHGGGCPGL